MIAQQDDPIAIIGLAGIFPGSSTVRQFFENVLRKRCFVRDLPDWLWDQSVFYSQDSTEPLKSYSRIGALLGDMEIDLTPFRIPPAVAVHMSLNQKLALLCAREAMLDAGYAEGSFDRERIGVIMAAVAGEMVEGRVETLLTQSLRARLNLLASNDSQRRMLEELWQSYDSKYPINPINEDTLPGELGSLVAGRIASSFDLHGMNLTIDSACASTLAAVSMAVTALRTNACDLVITGGVDADMSAGAFVTFSKINALSGRGSYPFDERSDGFVMGEGCGVFILKRYADAVRDDNQIYALIHGYGSSSDGAGKGITAPSTDGQLRALRRAYETNGFSPANLDFLECHATGTQVGDAEELTSISRFLADPSLGPARAAPLPIGTAKAMTGHLKTAAGAVGIFRAILAINSKVIPPQVNFDHPNPRFDWAGSQLRVPTRPEPIPDKPITVGVSSLGFGGTNFHVLLGSSPFNSRNPVVQVNDFLLPELPPLANDIALLFPGQGSQYVGMLSDLRADPDGEAVLERADRIVHAVSGRSLIETMYPESPIPRTPEWLNEREGSLRSTAIAQPAIFTVSVMLLQQLRKSGLRPGICIGHSLGEYTALYAAGILGFEEALQAVAMRGYLMESLTAQDAGAMAFISANREEVDSLIVQLDGFLTCANLNSYDQTVVAGETAAIEALVERALALGLKARRLNVDRAFHSRFLQPCIAPMREALKGLAPRYSQTPVAANLSRQVYPFAPDQNRSEKTMETSDRDRLIELLCKQIDHPVDFISQVELAYEAGARRFIEVGPKMALSQLVEDMLQGKSFQALGLDRPGSAIANTIRDLPLELSQPIQISRRPLPTRPRQTSRQMDQSAVSLNAGTPAETVRSLVSQISGYDITKIKDDADFERDLGIDTLKILQIIIRLRGTLLPNDFTNFRQATSIRKILALAEAGNKNAGRADGNHPVRCFEYKAVAAGKITPPASPAAGNTYRIEPGPGSTSVDGIGTNQVEGHIVNSAIIFPLPVRADVLCNETIPGLLSQIIAIADQSATLPIEPIIHLVSWGKYADESLPAAYRALCSFAKSCQKDLPYLGFSYTHVDGDRPAGTRLQNLLSLPPVLGRRIRADGTIEVGTLLQFDPHQGNTDQLAALLGPDDLVLVTGGARGIAASIVRHILPLTLARFLLIGQKPEPEAWFSEEGQQRVEYLACDLGNAAAIRRLDLAGRGITLVIHAAGSVLARPIREIDKASLNTILAAKVLGLEKIVDEIDVDRLRGVVNFSSTAAYFGGDGHPDYAAANGYLDGFNRPGLPVLSIGWTAWAQVGMAARSGAKEFLEFAGIESIPVQRGVEIFSDLLVGFLASRTPVTKNVIVRAGMAQTCFLPHDPFRDSMVAPTPDPAAAGKPAFRVNDPDLCLPDSMRNPATVAALKNAILPKAGNLSLSETGIILLKISAAQIGETYFDQVFSVREQEEIGKVKPEIRRKEKLAGKLAAKILAGEALRRWHKIESDLCSPEVIIADDGVKVGSPGNGELDALLRTMHFSISHSQDIVCAAVSPCPVGIDVERVRPLSIDDRAEIMKGVAEPSFHEASITDPPGSDWSTNPIVVFTQKEAILKASGTGMRVGLGDIRLGRYKGQQPGTATHLDDSFQVCSTLDGEYAFSLAQKVLTSRDATADAARPVVASYGQEGLWYLEKMEGIGAANCVAWTEHLWGNLDKAALTRSLQFLAARHESLRTIFRDVNGLCQAEVLPSLNLDPVRIDLSTDDPEAAMPAVDQRIEQEMQARFDLQTGPLVRAFLFQIDSEEHILLMLFHHAVIDATSALNLRGELSSCYNVFTKGNSPALAPLPFQYGEFARRQRAVFEQQSGKHIDYWKHKLAGHPGVLELPADRPRLGIQTYRAQSVEIPLSEDLLRQIEQSCERMGVTPFVAFLAALQTLLMRLSGQEDIIVGAPFVGRESVDTFSMVGYFVNTLPLRVDLAGNKSFRDMLQAVRSTVMETLEHQDTPFPKLVQALGPARNVAYPPLYQVVFRTIADEPEEIHYDGLASKFTELANKEIAYDLSIVIGLGEKRSFSRIEYNCALFEPSTIQRMAGQYVRLLEAAAANPDLALWDIPLLSEVERDQILRVWNDTQRPLPGLNVPELFENQVQETPGAVALAWDQGSMTYEQLNKHANQLAHFLVGLGSRSQEIIGLVMERSPEMIVALLGILKAGAAYLPIYPEDPPERSKHQLSDAKIRFIVTHNKASKASPVTNATVVNVDRLRKMIVRENTGNPGIEIGQDSLAYVMYTSGSAGQPKGVEISHRSIVRLLFGVEYAKLGPEQHILHLAPLAFDASTFEIWGALLHGGRCVLYPEAVPTLEKLGRVLHQEDITTLFLTTSLFNTVIDEAPEILQGVKQVLTGGEAQSVAHIHRAMKQLPGTEITNVYGPTEATTFTCSYPIPRQLAENLHSIPIGRPITNTSIYILDRMGRLCPVGVAGELHIGGPGLARGYLNQPTLTEAAFVQNPFQTDKSARLYKTGDIALWLTDGTIEFLGRNDRQVKLRGHRIELEEVEAALHQHPGIQEAAVLVESSGSQGKRLVAHVAPHQGQTLTKEEIHNHLQSRLPDYMLPSGYLMWESLPKTTSAKIDRQALTEYNVEEARKDMALVGARNETERQLAALWEEVLDKQPIGIEDDFFELGGHSLLAVRLFAAIERMASVKLPVSTILQYPTIAGLGRLLQREGWSPTWSSLVPLQTGGSKVPLYCIHWAGGNVLVYRDLARHLSPDQPVYGLQAVGTDRQQTPHTWIEEMAAYYIKEVLKFQPDGPYHLAGASMGGMIAFEMARQLTAAGAKVGLAGLLDTTGDFAKKPLPLAQRARLHADNLRGRSIGRQLIYPVERLLARTHELAYKLVIGHGWPLPKFMRDLKAINYQAALNYLPQPYAGKITLFRATQRFAGAENDLFLSWDKVAGGGIEVREVVGGHATMMMEPYVEQLAAVLRECLESSV